MEIFGEKPSQRAETATVSALRAWRRPARCGRG